MPRAGANTVYWSHSTVRAEQQQPRAPWKTPPWEEITSLWHWPHSVRRYGQPRFYQADSVFRKSIKETKKATKRQLKYHTCPVSCVFYVTQKEPHTAESHGGTRDLPAQPSRHVNNNRPWASRPRLKTHSHTPRDVSTRTEWLKKTCK